MAVAIGLCTVLAATEKAEARDKDKDKDCKKCEEQIQYCDFEPLLCALDELEKCDFLSRKKARDNHEDLLEWAEEAAEEAEDCDRDDALKKLGKIARRIDGLDCDDWLTEDAGDYISAILIELLDCLAYDESQCPHKDDDKDKCDHKECRGEDECKKDKCDHKECRGEDKCKKENKCGKCGDKHKDKDCKRD